MGGKFASLHVRGSNINEVINTLLSSGLEQAQPIDMDEVMNKLGLAGDDLFPIDEKKEEAFKELLSIYSDFQADCDIVDYQNGWISVYNEWYGWESIKLEGLEISKRLQYPVMTIGYFDDDVLELTVVKNNQVLVKYVAGDGVEVYGLKPFKINAKKFVAELELDMTLAEIKTIFAEDEDIWDVCQGIEKALGIAVRFESSERLRQIDRLPGYDIYISDSGREKSRYGED